MRSHIDLHKFSLRDVILRDISNEDYFNIFKKDLLQRFGSWDYATKKTNFPDILGLIKLMFTALI